MGFSAPDGPTCMVLADTADACPSGLWHTVDSGGPLVFAMMLMLILGVWVMAVCAIWPRRVGHMLIRVFRRAHEACR